MTTQPDFGISPITHKLVSIDGVDWLIHFPLQDHKLIFEDVHFLSLLKRYTAFILHYSWRLPFIREISFSGVPYTVLFKGGEHGISIASRSLFRELLLIEGYTALGKKTEYERLLTELKDFTRPFKEVQFSHSPSEWEFTSFELNLPRIDQEDRYQKVDEETQKLLKKLSKKVGGYSSSLFEKISDQGLQLTAEHTPIRLHLLKFLAVLPSLDFDHKGGEVKKILEESLRRFQKENIPAGEKPIPGWMKLAVRIVISVVDLLPAKVCAALVRGGVRLMAKRFIAGENVNTSDHTLRLLFQTGRDATLDQLGELVVSQAEAEAYFERVIQLIHGLKNHIPKGSKNSAGIYRSHVSIKVTALGHDLKPHAFDDAFKKVGPRLKRILQEAAREEVFINIDAEHYHFRDLVFEIYRKVLLETYELKEFSQTGIVLQAYLRDGSDHLKKIIHLGKVRGLTMPIRLVKGAYWDAETVEAEAHQIPAPQFLNKEESDLHFRQLAGMILGNAPHVQLTVGSHNLQDHCYVEVLRQQLYPNSPIIEHQCLHMTYEALSHALVKMGWPTRNYVPIGNLLMGMAYLVRRIMENSSQVGVLAIMRSHKKSSILRTPQEVMRDKRKHGQWRFDRFLYDFNSLFASTPLFRLYLEDERNNFYKEFHQYEKSLSTVSFEGEGRLLSVSPSDPKLVVGTVLESTAEEFLKKIESCKKAFTELSWSKPDSAPLRAAVLLQAAQLMLSKRNYLSSLIVFESGKTIVEAFADVDEAIDFLKFYAAAEVELLQQGKMEARGTVLVIAPWNFPLAIPCGMTVGSLAAGNSVILKPAEQTPLIAEELVNLLFEAGVPRDVLHVAHGDGEKIAAPFVCHPDIHMIVFTGSKGVGSWLYRTANAEIISHPRLKCPEHRQVVVEMGGKNAVIVTPTADLDEAISCILKSAYGHAGQKCSAASRILVHRSIKKTFTERLSQAVKDLKVGAAQDPATSINPLITEADMNRLRSITESAKDEAIRYGGRIWVDRAFEKNVGFAVGPVLLELPAERSKHPDSWAQKEIFGPVLHVIEYQHLMEAVELFNSTEYALTGGVFSQSQDDIDFLQTFLQCGNIYINRTNTGARVGIEPFGGFKMSGTGPKAGGKDYLRKFHFIKRPSLSIKRGTFSTMGSSYGYVPANSEGFYSLEAKKKGQQFTHELNSHWGKYGFPLEDQKVFEAWENWFQGELEITLQKRHPNIRVPGQLSFDSYSQIKSGGIVIIESSTPQLKVLLLLQTSIHMGFGLSFLCLSEEGYASWKLILEEAWKAGIPKSMIEIYLMNEKEIHHSLSKSGISFVFLDTEYERIAHWKEDILGSSNNELRLVLSHWDGEDGHDRYHWIKQFLNIRSFAINVMRHGAPLEIQS